MSDPSVGSGSGAPAAPGAEVEASTWVPVRTVRVGPWQAGVSDGFTRRANSALLVAGADPSEAVGALDDIEALYAGAGLPCIVRVPTAASPAPLDGVLGAELERRAYRTGVVTRVLARRIGEPLPEPGARLTSTAAPGARLTSTAAPGARLTSTAAPGARLTGAAVPDDAWLEAWLGTKSTISGGVALEAAVRLLTGSPATYLMARDVEGAPLGTIRVAHAGPWAALSCLAVASSARRRGLGRALTVAALTEAAPAGAASAFLQVEAGNDPAIALYAGLGFVAVDEYAYLHAPA